MMSFLTRDDRDARVDLEVFILQCGHAKRLSHARIVAGPPYVRFHFSDQGHVPAEDLDAVQRQLVLEGHDVRLAPRMVSVGVLAVQQGGLSVAEVEAAAEAPEYGPERAVVGAPDA